MKKSEGFTFIETLAVLAIGAILTAGTCISAVRFINSAKRTSAESSIRTYVSALNAYYIDCGTYPTEQQGLEALWKKPVLYPVPKKWNGPYIDREIKPDPWNNSFVYIKRDNSEFPPELPENLSFVLISYGEDGKKGGTGVNEDIVSW